MKPALELSPHPHSNQRCPWGRELPAMWASLAPHRRPQPCVNPGGMGTDSRGSFRGPGTVEGAGCYLERTSGNPSLETPEQTWSVWTFNRKEKGPNSDPSFLPATSLSPPSPPPPALPFQFLEIPRSSTASCREPQNPENWNSLPETC